jgi:hypothetical protein
VAFLHVNNEETEKTIRETIPYTTASKKVSCNKFDEGLKPKNFSMKTVNH